jgi:hypothetical protein
MTSTFPRQDESPSATKPEGQLVALSGFGLLRIFLQQFKYGYQKTLNQPSINTPIYLRLEMKAFLLNFDVCLRTRSIEISSSSEIS